MNKLIPALVGCALGVGMVAGGAGIYVDLTLKNANAAVCLDQCAQSEQVCHAVAERMGIVVTIPPWQAMVLTPILDPR